MRECNEFDNLFMQKSGEYAWKWIFKDVGCGRSIKLNQAEFFCYGLTEWRVSVWCRRFLS